MKHAILFAMLAAVLCSEARAYSEYTRAEVTAAVRQAESSALPVTPEGLLAALDYAFALRVTDPLAHELALQRLLLALRAQPPDPALRARVGQITGARPLAWTSGPDPDHAHVIRVPVADIGAIARGTLRHWDLVERVAQYAAALARGDLPALAPADPEALALALDRAGDAAVDAVLASPVAWPPEVLAVAAERRPSAASYRRLFAAQAGPATYSALARVNQRLAPADAVEVLSMASARPELASAAVLAMQPLAERADAQRFLLAQLGDPDRGGSAMQVLAEPGARVDREALQKLLDAGRDDPALRRAVAILQRLDDADARARLRAVAADARYPASLRSKIQRGLP